jgi:hypothetical protein
MSDQEYVKLLSIRTSRLTPGFDELLLDYAESKEFG